MRGTARGRAVGWAVGVLLGLVGAAAAGGCVFGDATPSGKKGPCDQVACSINGHCSDGKCQCDSGWVGDPYALHGCQAIGPASSCQTTCGLNAYCSDGACVCAEGFVAICGTGDCLSEAAVCDDRPDCPDGADEDPTVCQNVLVQNWRVTDGCDDGKDVQWRLWANDRDWVWPEPGNVFVTPGLDQTGVQSIECVEGERICFGGESGELEWGVGLTRDGACEDCCHSCSSDPVDVGALGCS